MTSLQPLLGIELPIIQAPMAGVQGSALAVAVSNAGALGSLPCAMLGLEAMRDELVAIKAQTLKPFNVNFFCHTPPTPNAEREAVWRTTLSPYYQEFGIDVSTVPVSPGRGPFSHEAADVLREIRPAVVSFHFGLPSPELLARVRTWGAKILSSATTVEEARWLESRGVDAIIAQGLEAGGHRGTFLSEDLTSQVGTFALVPQIVRAVKTPVIAAGGIADAKGVAAALALGAAGVQIGTAYLLCPEATTKRGASCCAEKRDGPPHRADERVHRPTRACNHEPCDEGTRPDEPLRLPFLWPPPQLLPCVQKLKVAAAVTFLRFGRVRMPVDARRCRPHNSREIWPPVCSLVLFLSGWQTPPPSMHFCRPSGGYPDRRAKDRLRRACGSNIRKIS